MPFGLVELIKGKTRMKNLKTVCIILAVLLTNTLLFSQDPLLPYLNSIPSIKDTISITENSGITAERFTFYSRDSINIVYGILVYPNNIAIKLPGVITFHGGGSRAEQVFGVAERYAKNGFVALAVDLPHLCKDCPNTVGPFKDLPGGEGPRLNVEGGAENSVLADAMIAALEAFNLLAAHPRTDSTKMGVTGSSWGGYTTTMMAGLLKERVKAAYSVFGCGFWDKGSFWYNSLNQLSSENKSTWLKYYDAGRRAANIIGNYFIYAPTNDTYFWPVAVQATLDTIKSYTNHVFEPNLNHKTAESLSRLRWMEYHLKDSSVPGLSKARVISSLQLGEGRQITFDLEIPDGVRIIDSKLWYADSDEYVTDRNWQSLSLNKISDSIYTAEIPSYMAGNDLIYFGSFEDQDNIRISTSIHSIDQLFIKDVNREHDLVAYALASHLTNIPQFAYNVMPEVEIRNHGSQLELNVPVTCNIDSLGKTIYTETKIIDEIKPFEILKLKYPLWNTPISGEYNFSFIIELDDDEDQSTNALEAEVKVSGLLDNFENDYKNWITSSTWGIDNRRSYSGKNSMSIYPDKRYEDNDDSFSQFRFSFNFESVDSPVVSFWSQTIMAEGDTGYVEVSDDGGLVWLNIGNKYSGISNDWIFSEISLSRFKDKKDIRLRFHFISDSVKNHLGWFIDDIKIDNSIATGIESRADIQEKSFTLFNNYPNPFNPSTIIEYTIPAKGNVELKIYDLLGKEIVTLVNDEKPKGFHKVNFTAEGLASGVYFYILKYNESIKAKKLLLMR